MIGGLGAAREGGNLLLQKMEERSTEHYGEYLRYSAFDYALTKPNVTYRRDGCGGAVHSNERKLNEEAFRRLMAGHRALFEGMR